MLFKKIILTFLLLVLYLNANTQVELYSTYKESCVHHSDHKVSNKELKNILIQQVKRNAIEELFGAKLHANTTIHNGKLLSDTIKQSAIGNIRIKGQPIFYNGNNFGEMCTKIKAYITQEDYEKYQPQIVSIKRFCYNRPDIALNQLKSQAKYAAYKRAITKYKPKLHNISNKLAEELIQGFEFSNESLDIQTGVYCMDFSATFYPYQLDLENTTADNSYSKQINQAIANGLIATFYNTGDYNFSKPLYTTNLNSDLSLFGTSFTNKKLQKNKAYYIRIIGFIESQIDRYANFQLKADVYSAEIKINNKRVLNKHEPKGGTALIAGKNTIEIVITSSNAYDIELLEKRKDGTYTPISNTKLYPKE